MHYRTAMPSFIIPILGAFASMAGPAVAQNDLEPWNRMYVVLVAGQVASAATLNRQGDFQAVDTRNELEYGVGLGATISRDLDGDLVFTRMGTSAQQPGSGSSSLQVSIDSMKLSGTLRKKYSDEDALLTPWWGGGFDINSLILEEGEVLSAEPGPYRGGSSKRVTTAAGLHLAAGCDLRPVPQSALALRIEARYTGYLTTGLLDATLDGWSFYAGIRWDFWQIGR